MSSKLYVDRCPTCQKLHEHVWSGANASSRDKVCPDCKTKNVYRQYDMQN